MVRALSKAARSKCTIAKDGTVSASSSATATSTRSPHRQHQQHHHIPYLNSKLTHFLKGSLGGNCRTVLICCAQHAEKLASLTSTTLTTGALIRRVPCPAKVNHLALLGHPGGSGSGSSSSHPGGNGTTGASSHGVWVRETDTESLLLQ